MTDDTYENTLELAVSLLRKYKLTENDLWLHQTVVGWKDCHRYFVNNNDEWIKFKTLAGEMLRGKANLNVEVNTRDIVIVDDYTPASNILKLGSKGNKVTDLQKKLIAAGESLLKYGSDGDFGKETEDAVISFQRKMNISVDGIVGNETLKALEKAIADLNKVKVETKTETKKEVVDPVVKGVEVKSSRPTIRLTSPLTKNEHVEVVQRAVGAKVDGYFGKQTENKVKVYQKVNGLHSDGIVGKNTWNVIDNPKPTTKPTPTPSKATSSIKSIGKIQIVNVANAAIIMDSPDKHKANNIGLLRKGSKIDICGSVTGKHNPQGYWEVIFKGKRGYVSGQFGKRV
jgi:peptidoglycan hydrolase-like protein with peptidoglycan-binding domain